MKKAKLTVYYGPMYSGKSALLIKDINFCSDLSKLIFKPKGDIRTNKVYSREGIEIEAIEIDSALEIMAYIKNEVDIIYIDEFHFFGEELTKVIEDILNLGIKIVIAGLDTDFRTEEFKVATNLIKMSDNPVRLEAKCSICGTNSTLTARFIDGKPAPKDSPTILSDNSSSNLEYQTVCKNCHPFLNK